MQQRAVRNLKLLNFLAVLFSLRTFEGILPVYFALITGSYATAMTMFAVMHVASSALEVPTGWLSDQVGRKKTLLLYSLTGFAATLCIYLADSTSMLILAMVFMGASIAFGSGTLQAFIYENLEVSGDTDRFKEVHGRYRAFSKYALVAGGLLGTGLIFLYDIKVAILPSVVFGFLSLIAAFFLKDLNIITPNKSNIYHDLRTALQNFKMDASLRDFSIGRMTTRGLGNVEYRFRSLFFTTIMPDWLINFLGILNGMALAIAMQATHRIINKIGIVRSMIHIQLLNRVIAGVGILLGTLWSGVVMGISNSASFGVSEITSEDLLQKRYSKKQRATMGSLVGIGGSVIYILAAMGAGALADQVGLVKTMLIFQAVLLVPTLFFWRGLRRS